MTFSRWRSVTLAFSETFEALVSGLQDAFWGLGGVPEVLRSDNCRQRPPSDPDPADPP